MRVSSAPQSQLGAVRAFPPHPNRLKFQSPVPSMGSLPLPARRDRCGAADAKGRLRDSSGINSTASTFGKAHARCTWMGLKTCGNTARPAAAAMLIASIAPAIPPTVVASTRKMSMPLTRSKTTRTHSMAGCWVGAVEKARIAKNATHLFG